MNNIYAGIKNGEYAWRESDLLDRGTGTSIFILFDAFGIVTEVTELVPEIGPFINPVFIWICISSTLLAIVNTYDWFRKQRDAKKEAADKAIQDSIVRSANRISELLYKCNIHPNQPDEMYLPEELLTPREIEELAQHIDVLVRVGVGPSDKSDLSTLHHYVERIVPCIELAGIEAVQKLRNEVYGEVGDNDWIGTRSEPLDH